MGHARPSLLPRSRCCRSRARSRCPGRAPRRHLARSRRAVRRRPSRPCPGSRQPDRRAHRLQRGLRAPGGHRSRHRDRARADGRSARGDDAGRDRRDAGLRPRRDRHEAGRLDRLRGRHGVGAGGAGSCDTWLPGDSRLGPAAGLGALIVRGAGARVVAGALGRRAAGAGPHDPGPNRAARGERVRGRQLRADGPVRVGLRAGGARAAARLPERWTTVRSRWRIRTSRSSPATPARRASSSRPPTTSAGASARPP